MALPFDTANFNLTNFANIYPDVMDSSPKNVSYQYKDADGNIQTKTIANRGKFKQQLWDDVGAALGQFNRTFYVDADNGDDNNDGSSNNPFKTIKKAVDSVPIGGYGSINVAYGSYIINAGIAVINKVIIIAGQLDGDGNKPTITFTESSSAGQLENFHLTNSSIVFQNFELILPKPTYNVTNITNARRYAIALRNGSRFYLYKTDATINKDDNYGAFILSGLYSRNSEEGFGGFATLGDCSIVADDIVYYIGRTAFFNTDGSISVKDSVGNDRAITDIFNGIVKDANGVPRNILSNVVF